MNDLNQPTGEPSETQPAPSSQRSYVVWTLALAVAMPLLINIRATKKMVAESKRQLLQARSELDDAETRRKECVRQEFELIEAQRESARMATHIREIYRQYRSVEDFAKNPSPFVVSVTSSFGNPMHNTLNLSIPEGEHRLGITFDKVAIEGDEVLDSTAFNYTLSEPGAYRVVLDHTQQPGTKYSDPRQLRLQITSSNESFRSIDEELFEPFRTPSGSSSSWPSAVSPLFFPNQYERRDPSPGVLVNAMTWSIQPEDGPSYRFRIAMRLYSEGPLVTNPDEVSRLKYQKEVATRPIGNGMFLVEPKADPDATTD